MKESESESKIEGELDQESEQERANERQRDSNGGLGFFLLFQRISRNGG